MPLIREIKSCRDQIEELENILQKASNCLAGIKQHLLAIEEIRMQEDLPQTVNLMKEPEKKEEKELLPLTFLGDKITKSIYADLKKSLTLNDRFRFQKDLFGNDVRCMDNTLNDLNAFSSLKETTDYLRNRFAWNWEDESTLAFKEILEKRFS
jgi:predicted  nucleic acid-binding Zn-ribbon protein